MSKRLLISHTLTAAICLVIGSDSSEFLKQESADVVEKNQNLSNELSQIKNESQVLHAEPDSLRDICDNFQSADSFVQDSSSGSHAVQSNHPIGNHTTPSQCQEARDQYQQ